MDVIRHHFNTIDSTNTWCKLHADEFSVGKLTLVTADTQTAGRGRFKRRWESPAGQNIYATFCFFVEGHTQEIGNIPQILALSTAAVLKKLNFTPELKWPNDVLLSGKKVAGILAETTTVGNRLCVVIGIGLNVNMPKATMQLIDRPATSLMVEGGHSFDIENVLKDLQDQFSYDLDQFFKEGFAAYLETYRDHMSKDPHKIIRFHDNKFIWEGTLQAINPDGSLCLRLMNGETKTFIAGEILWPGEY